MDGAARILAQWTRAHPSLAGDAERRRARLAAGLLLALLPLCAAALLLIGVRPPFSSGTALTAGASLAIVGAFLLVRSGRVSAGIVLALVAVEGVLASSVPRADDHTSAMLVLGLFAIPIAMAGVLLRTRWAVAVSAATILLALALDSSLDGHLLGPPDSHAYLLALMLGGVAVLAVAASATVQAQARALSETAALLRQVTENIPEVLFVVAADGSRVHYTSPAYEAVTGRTVAQSMADPLDWLKAVHPEDLPRVRAELAAGRADLEYRIVHPSGQVRHLRARTFPVLGRAGKVDRLVGIAEDVTAAREAERRLRQAQEERIHLLQQLAHDLGSPLTPVKIQLRLLQAHVGAAGQEGLAILKRNVDHLQRLVEDVRDVARLEGRALRLAVQPADLAELARQAVAALEAPAAERGVALAVEAPAACPARVDPGRVTQVLYNLVGNALKFTPAGGRIDVRVACGDREAAVTVRDSGRGMRPDQVARLFQPFSQVHDPGTVQRAEDRGSGLGLYISKGLVEAHGGTIAAASDGPGHGSAFTFRLPLGGPGDPAGPAGRA